MSWQTSLGPASPHRTAPIETALEVGECSPSEPDPKSVYNKERPTLGGKGLDILSNYTHRVVIPR